MSRKRVSLTVFNTQHPIHKLGLQTDHPPISSSLISEWNQCQRKAFWRYALGLVPRGIQADPLVTGTLTHAGLGQKVLGAGPGVIASVLDDLCRRQLDSIRVEGQAPEWATSKLAELRARSIAMVDAIPPVARGKVFAVEEAIRVTLPPEVLRRPIVLVGTVDVMERLDDGTIIITDWKTDGRSAVGRAEVCTIEVQPLLYRILASAAVGEQVDIVRHVIIRKPTIKQKQNETLSDYCLRVKQWYKDYQVAHPGQPPVVISEVRHGELYPKHLLKQIWNTWVAFNRRYDIENFPPTGAPHHCIGSDDERRPCPYKRLCFSDPVLWPEQMLNFYQQDFRYKETPRDLADRDDT